LNCDVDINFLIRCKKQREKLPGNVVLLGNFHYKGKGYFYRSEALTLTGEGRG
jgi:hypothetical protein